MAPTAAGPRVVKTSASGRELVEVDGFTFIRKRAVEPTAPAPESKRITTPPTSSGAVSAPAQPSPRPSQPSTSAPERCSSSLQQQQAESQGQRTPGAAPPSAQEAEPNPVPPTQPIEPAAEPAYDDQAPQSPSAVQAALDATVLTLPLEDAEPEPIHTQLLNCLPSSMSTVTRVQVMVTHLLQQTAYDTAARTKDATAAQPPAEDSALLDVASEQVSAAFCQLLRDAVTSARHMLVDIASQPATAPTTAPTTIAPAEYSALAPMLRAAAEGPDLRTALTQRLAALTDEADAWTQVLATHAHAGNLAGPSAPRVTGAADVQCETGGVGVGSGAGAQGTSDTCVPVLSGVAALVSLAEEFAWQMTPPRNNTGSNTTTYPSQHATTQATEPQPPAITARHGTPQPQPVPAAGQGVCGSDSAQDMAVCVSGEGCVSVAQCELARAATHAVSALECTVLRVEDVLTRAALTSDTAQRAANELQALYHARKFTALPLETPRALIKGLSAAPGGGALQMATPM